MGEGSQVHRAGDGPKAPMGTFVVLVAWDWHSPFAKPLSPWQTDCQYIGGPCTPCGAMGPWPAGAKQSSIVHLCWLDLTPGWWGNG